MFIEPSDLAPFATIDAEKAAAMIADAEAQAVVVAPCLARDGITLTKAQLAYVVSILRRAILRWNETGDSGAVTTTHESAGPWSQTMTVQNRSSRGLFWPSEIADLQRLCEQIDGTVKSDKVFTIQTGGVGMSPHADICSLRFGALTCSCGANLTAYRYPLWEGGVIS